MLLSVFASCCSFSENRWEGCLEVAQVSLDGWGRLRLNVMSLLKRLNLGLFFAFNGLLARNEFERVFFVLWEWGKAFVVAVLSGI